MTKKNLYALWGGLYGVCALLGFVPAPVGFLKWFLVALAVTCFVPPLLLIHSRKKQIPTLKLIRNLALLWLVLTLALLIGNFSTALASETVGSMFYSVLVIVSSPMICGQYWVLSLFGWAYLLFDCIHELRRANQKTGN